MRGWFALGAAALLAGCSAATASRAATRPATTTTVATSGRRADGRDPQRTPGFLNPDVTQATIATTICTTGWTATIRPPSTYTTDLKRQQLADGYTYGGDTNPVDYEEDHFVPLELGGAPTSTANLWPQPHDVGSGYGSRTKDGEETALKRQVCAGQVTLAAAQDRIRADW